MADIQDSISNKPTESSESSPRISATEKVELSRSRQAEIISEIERAIRNATSPLELEYDRDETIKVGEYEGYYLNKREAQEKWSGSVPLDEYPLNEDTNPEVIRKKPTEKIVYEQQIGVRYLKPPMAPPPGDLIIRERVRSSTEPAPPPIIIRQIAQKKNKKENECNKCGLPRSPSPIIYREAPPPPPPHIPEQVIEVEKFIPPTRRVILERVPAPPTPPPKIIVEKWLPYPTPKRRIVYEKVVEPEPRAEKNLIIQWQYPPNTRVKRRCKSLGVERADPDEYRQRYVNELRRPSEISRILKVPPPLPQPTIRPSRPPVQRSRSVYRPSCPHTDEINLPITSVCHVNCSSCANLAIQRAHMNCHGPTERQIDGFHSFRVGNEAKPNQMKVKTVKRRSQQKRQHLDIQPYENIQAASYTGYGESVYTISLSEAFNLDVNRHKANLISKSTPNLAPKMIRVF